MQANMQRLKVAWIRDQDVPPGRPALGRLNCPCGQAPRTTFDPSQGNVRCTCGTVYTYNGWIVEEDPDPMKNELCEGIGPCARGEVRKLPVGRTPDHGNMILCRLCFGRELEYRRDRNKTLDPDCRFALPTWESLDIYEGCGGPPTVQLRDGRRVLAKPYKGELHALTYVNETQARKKLAELGAGWHMTGYRPYYITLDA